MALAETQVAEFAVSLGFTRLIINRLEQAGSGFKEAISPAIITSQHEQPAQVVVRLSQQQDVARLLGQLQGALIGLFTLVPMANQLKNFAFFQVSLYLVGGVFLPA